MPRATQDASRLQSASRTGLSPSAGRLSRRFRSPSSCHILVLQPRRNRNPGGLGCSPVARHYWGNHVLFSLPLGTKMFQFPRFASTTRWMTVRQTAGLPHSDIRGSQVACTSPRLFAACRVLRRLPEPRHPPCALGSFRRASGDWPPRAYLGFYLRVLVLVRTINLYVVVCLHRGVSTPQARFFCSSMSMNGRGVRPERWRITDSNR